MLPSRLLQELLGGRVHVVALFVDLVRLRHDLIEDLLWRSAPCPDALPTSRRVRPSPSRSLSLMYLVVGELVHSGSSRDGIWAAMPLYRVPPRW